MQRKRLCIKGLQKFDLFTQPIQLLVDEKEYHQTIFGSILTFGLFLLFSTLLYTKLHSLFDRNNPTSLSSEIYHSQPDNFQLLPQNFTMTFAFQNSTFHTYIDDSIYVVKAQLVRKYQKVVDGNKSEVWDRRELPLIQCSSSMIIQKDLNDYFSHLDLPTNYCIDWNKIDKINLEGAFDASAYQYVIIQFFLCTEQTRKEKECKDEEEIKKALEQNYFSFQISSYTTNLKNPYSPYNPKGQDLFTTISSNIQKEISVYLEPLTTVTDIGLIQTELEYYQTLRYGRHTEMLDINSNELIMNVIIRLDTTEYVEYRKYSKIQEILAELGGLWQVLFSLFYIISKPINKISRYIELINQLIELNDPQNKDENSCLKHEQLSRQEQDSSPLQLQIPKIQINQQQEGFSNKINQEKLDDKKKQQNNLRKLFLHPMLNIYRNLLLGKKRNQNLVTLKHFKLLNAYLHKIMKKQNNLKQHKNKL